MLHDLKLILFLAVETPLCGGRPWSMLVSSLADTRTSARRIAGSAQSVAPEDWAALECATEMIAAALPEEDALSALTTYRSCDEGRCIDCPMEVLNRPAVRPPRIVTAFRSEHIQLQKRLQ
jgi:hypothetical protein